MAKLIINSVIQTSVDRASLEKTLREIKSRTENADAKVNVRLQTDTKGLERNLITVTRRVSDVEKKFVEAGAVAKNFGRELGGYFIRFSAFSLAAASVLKLINSIRQINDEAVDFDTNLVKISQTLFTTRRSLGGLTEEIFKLSTGMGSSSQELVNASLILAQAGLSAKDTTKALRVLSQTTISPSFKDMNNSVRGMIAIMGQFGVTVDQLEAKFGAINQVSKQYAVEAEDIVEAVRIAGGTFATTGSSLEEFIALFTAIRDTTQESAATVAQAIKTISARIQRPATVDFLESIGIRGIRDEVTGEFKGVYQAFREISKAVQQLQISPRSVQFAQLVEQLGGYRQYGKVIPAILQFAKAEEALGIAFGGTNSLIEDQYLAQDSLAIALQRATESWKQFVVSLSQDEGIRSFLTLSFQLISTIGKLGETFKEVIPYIALLGAARIVPTTLRIGKSITEYITKDLPGKADGGYIPGQGTRDDVPTMLMRGEYVLKKDAVNSLGLGNVDYMNNTGRLPGFAKGGPVRIPGVPAVAKPDLAEMRKLVNLISNFQHLSDSDAAMLSGISKDQIFDLISKYKDIPIAGFGKLGIYGKKDIFDVFIKKARGGLVQRSLAPYIEALGGRYPDLKLLKGRFNRLPSRQAGVFDPDKFGIEFAPQFAKGLPSNLLQHELTHAIDYIAGNSQYSTKDFKSTFGKVAYPLRSNIDKVRFNYSGSNKGIIDHLEYAGDLREALAFATEGLSFDSFIKNILNPSGPVLNKSLFGTLSNDFKNSGILEPEIHNLLSAFSNRFETGGYVNKGSGSKDDVPSLLKKGEFVVNSQGVRNIGANFLHGVNNGNIRGFASGTPGDFRLQPISGSTPQELLAALEAARAARDAANSIKSASQKFPETKPKPPRPLTGAALSASANKLLRSQPQQNTSSIPFGDLISYQASDLVQLSKNLKPQAGELVQLSGLLNVGDLLGKTQRNLITKIKERSKKASKQSTSRLSKELDDIIANSPVGQLIRYEPKIPRIGYTPRPTTPEVISRYRNYPVSPIIAGYTPNPRNPRLGYTPPPPLNQANVRRVRGGSREDLLRGFTSFRAAQQNKIGNEFGTLDYNRVSRGDVASSLYARSKLRKEELINLIKTGTPEQRQSAATEIGNTRFLTPQAAYALAGTAQGRAQFAPIAGRQTNFSQLAFDAQAATNQRNTKQALSQSVKEQLREIAKRRVTARTLRNDPASEFFGQSIINELRAESAGVKGGFRSSVAASANPALLTNQVLGSPTPGGRSKFAQFLFKQRGGNREQSYIRKQIASQGAIFAALALSQTPFFNKVIGGGTAGAVTQGALGLGITGASIGAGFGPGGAAIGGAIGIVAGVITSLDGLEKDLKEQKIGDALEQLQRDLTSTEFAQIGRRSSQTDIKRFLSAISPGSLAVETQDLLGINKTELNSSRGEFGSGFSGFLESFGQLVTGRAKSYKLTDLAGLYGTNPIDALSKITTGFEDQINRRTTEFGISQKVTARRGFDAEEQTLKELVRRGLVESLADYQKIAGDKYNAILETGATAQGKATKQVERYIKSIIDSGKAVVSATKNLEDYQISLNTNVRAQTGITERIRQATREPILTLGSNPADFINRRGLSRLGTSVFGRDLNQLPTAGVTGGLSVHNDLLKINNTLLSIPALLDSLSLDPVVFENQVTALGNLGNIIKASADREGIGGVKASPDDIAKKYIQLNRPLLDEVEASAKEFANLKESILGNIQTFYTLKQNVADAFTQISASRTELAATRRSFAGLIPSAGGGERVFREGLLRSVGTSSLGGVIGRVNSAIAGYGATGDSAYIIQLNAATEALKKFTDVTGRTRDIQERLNAIEASRASKIGLAERIFTSEGSERRKLLSSTYSARAFVATGARFESLNKREQLSVIEGLRNIGSGLIGEKTGNQIADEIFSRISGYDKTPEAGERKGLQEQIIAAQKESIAAQTKLAEVQERIFREFASKLDPLTTAFVTGSAAAATTSAALSEFNRGFGSHIARLDEVTKRIPTKIDFEAKHTVNVVFNGAEVLKGMEPAIAAIAVSAANKAVQSAFGEKLPDVGTPKPIDLAFGSPKTVLDGSIGPDAI